METETVLLFSYGSNMMFDRLSKRIDSAEIICIGYLPRYTFKLNKVGKIGGKANIEYTGNIKDRVYGVINRITFDDKELLTRIEGGYDHKYMEIFTPSGIMRCLTYTANPMYVRDGMVPSEEYKAYIYTGAIENNLPIHYIEELQKKLYML